MQKRLLTIRGGRVQVATSITSHYSKDGVKNHVVYNNGRASMTLLVINKANEKIPDGAF